MKAQSIPSTSGIREARLLLVGSEDDFKGGVTGEVMGDPDFLYAALDTTECAVPASRDRMNFANFNKLYRKSGGKRSFIAGRSATLLGALARLHSGAIDVVLLSHKFRDEEVALFTADARRSGFQGLILRVASQGARAPGVHRENELMSGAISFTDRQRTVLAYVSKGWANQQIAENLKCTEAAIKAVVQELFRKLAVRKRAQIVRVAIEKGLIKIDGNPVGSAFALRLNLSDQQSIRVGDFIIDVATHQAWVRGVETHLTPSEFQLLWILATHSGKLVKSSALREMFWRNPTARVGSLRVLVGTLRSKIEATKTPRYLITERSLGYRLIPSPSLSEADRPPCEQALQIESRRDG
jgi:DNA-binding CsgD family transcriptional regulator/DNA-binding winged helix-turn-helix (wHTH) protein